MITGFNTDVEHDGVVYHVQTEDKGLDTPLILSLVYAGGAILASKRSPYDDLIASGFNEQTLAERLQRQHMLICAAVSAGRIEDLRRMSERDAATRAAQRKAASAELQSASLPVNARRTLEKKGNSGRISGRLAKRTSAPLPKDSHATRSSAQEAIADFAREEAAAANALRLRLIDEKEFRGGNRLSLRVRVTRGGEQSKDVVSAAHVTVKVLGSTFRPLTFQARTGDDGIAVVNTELPHFRTGRAAILVRAEAGGYEAELRRIVLQG